MHRERPILRQHAVHRRAQRGLLDRLRRVPVHVVQREVRAHAVAGRPFPRGGEVGAELNDLACGVGRGDDVGLRAGGRGR